MTTPRALSDAVKADYDRLVELDASGQAAQARWELTRTISGSLILGIALALAVLMLASMSGAVIAGVLFVMLMLGAPFLVIPAAVVFAVAHSALTAGRRRTRARMFTLYGIDVDDRIAPAVYRVNVPATWLHPQLTETRRLLAPSHDTTPAPAVPARAHIADEEPAPAE